MILHQPLHERLGARRRFVLLSLVIAITSSGCGGGGGDSTGPADPFPDVSGSYNIEGGFDGLTSSQASFVGSLTLNQTSRQSGELTGTMSLTLNLEGDVTTAGNVAIQSASVTPNGTVSFQLGSISSGGSWTFTGTAAGDAITGRHTLADGTNSFSGDWAASTGSVGTGSVSVTASTSGSMLDPDGYTLVIDGAERGTLSGNNPLTISGLAAGNHAVGLTGVADNCAVQNDNPLLVSISAGATASVSFAVVCTTPPPNTGGIRVVTSTSGADLDPDGYLATLDGGQPGLPVPVAGSATFLDVAVGSHTVVLSGLASNCTVAGGGSATTTVTSGVTSEVTFSVTCTAIPPSTGSIKVTTITSGPDPDPDGYTFSIDGGAAQAIGIGSSQTVIDIAIGNHTVALSGLADNCSAAGGLTQSVAVTGGQTAEVDFTIACTAVGPSASRSTITASPTSFAAGGSSAITVTVVDASGASLGGVPVTLSITGTGNTITPESVNSDASGVAIFSFKSIVAEGKTITATAGGVKLDHNLSLNVFLRGSSTEITGIDPEPSSAGQTITVTVKVTGDAGTPTGTVAVFSDKQTGGCDAASLDPQGVATCQFALDVVGTHKIGATYSGDAQYQDSSDPDGQQHEVIAAASGTQQASR